MFALSDSERRLVRSMGLLSLLCLALLVIRIVATGTFHLAFIIENLALAWIVPILSWFLVKSLAKRSWSSGPNILLSAVWLFFLPNTWYVLTDFVHVGNTGEISQIFDIVMMSTFVFVGFALGFASLYKVHLELLKRLRPTQSYVIIGLILLLSSFAIYIGRDLRWSTWDVIINPSGLILNVSDRVVDPFGSPRAFNLTGLFFVLLCTIYAAIWIALPPSKKRPS